MTENICLESNGRIFVISEEHTERIGMLLALGWTWRYGPYGDFVQPDWIDGYSDGLRGWVEDIESQGYNNGYNDALEHQEYND